MNPDEPIRLEADVEDIDDESVAGGSILDEDGACGGVHLARVAHAQVARQIFGAVDAPGRGVVGLQHQGGAGGDTCHRVGRGRELVGQAITRDTQHA